MNYWEWRALWRRYAGKPSEPGTFMDCSVPMLHPYFALVPLRLSPLEASGQPSGVAELSGVLALWMLPLHFSFAFQFPLQRFLQSQLKMGVIAWVSLAALLVHLFVTWLFVYTLKLNVIGVAVTLNFSWWALAVGLFGYTVLGGCPLTWTGFSIEAFSGLWEFVKLSAASGLENWYYRVLILMTGNLKNAEIAVDALSICMNINGWEMMIPLAFFAGTGYCFHNPIFMNKSPPCVPLQEGFLLEVGCRALDRVTSVH
ncbi:unnamed protein product [Thlaspi arvense]|uniref:Protein TRANSPARENT TESTA 12 n=1 Tax=Thlaspi arvense TaxID=13288 RepID=A0AAU9RKR4_THLAR|nr:unnamed protein product [Thlaspi arvense]